MIHAFAQRCRRSLAGVAILALVVLVVALPYLWGRVDEEIRRRVLLLVADHYDDLHVSIRSASRVTGTGIVLRGMTIRRSASSDPRGVLLQVDEVAIDCNSDLSELMTRPPAPTRVVLRRPTLRMSRRADGSWTSAMLLPFPKFSERLPEIQVEGGTIEMFDPFRNPPSTLVYRDVQLTVRPERFTPISGAADSAASIHGTALCDHFTRVELSGHVVADGSAFSLSGTIEGLELAPELYAALPGDFADQLKALDSLRARAKVHFDVVRRPDTEEPVRFEVTSDLARGRIEDPRLPYPLEDVQAHVVCNNQGVTVENLTARNGPTTISLNGHRSGYDENSPLYAEVVCNQFRFDDKLRDFLPEGWHEVWGHYRPAGEIDARLIFAFDGRAWNPDLSVECRNVSFTHHDFPYRLQRGRGTLTLKDDVLDINLAARSTSGLVQIAGRIQHPGPAGYGYLDITSDSIRFDQELFDALAQPVRNTVLSLHPDGDFRLEARVWRPPGSTALARRKAIIHLNRCAMRFEHCPYSFHNVEGQINVDDAVWTFANLSGTNDTGRFTCSGQLAPGEGGYHLALDFTGTDVPLDAELRAALGPAGQQLWTDLKPRGSVDAEWKVRYVTNQPGLGLWARIVPRPDATSIEPAAFPYRLDNVSGVAVYDNGTVHLERFRARHGNVQFDTRGQCQFFADGAWRIAFDDLSVDRLRIDRDLYTALPERLKTVVNQLNPTGSMNLRGMIAFARSAAPEEPVAVDWDLNLLFQHSSIDCQVLLNDISGGVRLSGRFDGRRVASRGALDLDSLTYKDVQITEIRGPIWIDDDRVLFGSWAERKQSDENKRYVTAKLYGGTVLADLAVLQEATPRYHFRASVVNADLNRLSNEAIRGRQELHGEILGGLDVQGNALGPHTLSGQGYLRLRNADIYELPQMVRLLSLLSIKPPDDTAFTDSDIDFWIGGEHVYFDRITFNGDAVSLVGTGQMDLDTNLELTFYTMIGRQDWQLPIIGDVSRAAAQQIFQIQVTGDVAEPRITRETFPGVSQALQQLVVDIQNGPMRARGNSKLLPDLRAPLHGAMGGMLQGDTRLKNTQ